jgi:crotonyl-CoA carboxylase/reductase
LPGIAEGEPITIADDGTKVRDLMHRGIISCKPEDTARHRRQASWSATRSMPWSSWKRRARPVGVVSQTDMVLARQGRTPEQARAMLASGRHDPGLRDL